MDVRCKSSKEFLFSGGGGDRKNTLLVLRRNNKIVGREFVGKYLVETRQLRNKGKVLPIVLQKFSKVWQPIVEILDIDNALAATAKESPMAQPNRAICSLFNHEPSAAMAFRRHPSARVRGAWPDRDRRDWQPTDRKRMCSPLD